MDDGNIATHYISAVLSVLHNATAAALLRTGVIPPSVVLSLPVNSFSEVYMQRNVVF